MRGLQGKRALVTGGTKGIGLATAHRLLEEGCAVIACGRDPAAIAEASAALGGAGEAFVRACDVSDSTAVDALVGETRDLLGGLDLLVNNAGVFFGERAVEMSDETWTKTVAINLSGAFYAARAAARVMVEQGGGGAIVNVASVNALPGSPENVAYDATKGGVLAMTYSLASELARHGIRVNAICPGLIWTPMVWSGETREQAEGWADRHTLLRRVGDPAEIAAAIAFMASDEGSYMTGAHLVVDGGQLARM